MSRDLSGVIARIGLEKLTGTRKTGGSYDASGRFQPGANAALSFEGNVQPLSGLDLERLPEGFRTTAQKKLYTTALLVVEPEPDVLVYRGVSYQVAQLSDWTPLGSFNRYLLLKVQAP